MATKKRGSDEGGSGSENKGRVPRAPEETRQFDEGPYGDTAMDRDIEELEKEGLMAGDTPGSDRHRERIASNPDNEEELAEETLESSAEEAEDEAGHRGGRRE
jgi:hypothetical protein